MVTKELIICGDRLLIQIKALNKVCPKIAPFYPEDKSLQTQMTRECNFLIRIFS